MPNTPSNLEKAVFACGCFWSKEYLFSQQKGVVATQVGYTGGHTSNPTYQQVCTKTTDHAEAVEILYNPHDTSFEQLTRFFFKIHDPTIDRTDKGGQYRSAIFYQNEQQKKTAIHLIEQLQRNGYSVKTTLEPASTFWKAEERHQGYCENRGFIPRDYSQNRFTKKTTL